MTEDIARLIGLLDHDSVESAEDAKAKLMWIGVDVIQPLMSAVPFLHRYGQLSAIEIFEQLGDPRAVPVLIDLLDCEHETVREWSALALAKLNVRTAAPALQAAYQRLRTRGTPPDFSEAVALRGVLTEFGARRAVMPPLTASLRVSISTLDAAWPVTRLEEVINDLAEHDQAVLYFQLWTTGDSGTYWTSHETLHWEFDSHAPWPRTVATARDAALLEAAFITIRENLFATVEWIDESDA
ncbi:HEAT repeat domain-containing protein [Microbispora sp. NPDC049125]|uniref:HEAT repeat domain-containing protein n=1 Tax=Microbispora sp. NPDC049125 TaxID=3154929 RepID=UPI0034663B90